MNVPTRNMGLRGLGSVRRFAIQSAPKGRDLQQGQTGSKGEVSTRLPNGLTIIAVENNSPISRIGVVVRAGARFEKMDQLGVTHALRNAAGLSTKKSSFFGITRNIDHLAGSLTASATHEDLIYTVDATRDQIALPLSLLADTVTRALFKPWEIEDESFRMHIDRQRMHSAPDVRLIELLHKAAFSSGLSNSLYSPGFMIGKHDHNMLNTFVDEHFTTKRMAVVGTGVELPNLVKQVEKLFEMRALSAPEIVKPKFVAGNLRKNTDTNIAYVAVAAEGASAKNRKEALALALFQQVLGTGPRVKYSEGKVSPLGSAAAQGTEHPFALTGVNVNYSDTGLFGFAVGAAGSDIHKVVKAIVKKMREVGKGLNEEQLKTAKHQLKAAALMSLESPAVLLEELGVDALNGGTLEALTVDAVVDSVTLNDLKEVVGKVLKGKVAIASVGQTGNVPFIDDLV